MLIIDDIVSFPMSGLLWIFQEIRDAAEQKLEAQADSITVELQQLYVMLERGQITEEEFDRRETDLLDRLDQIENGGDLLVDDDDEEFAVD